MDSAQLAEWMAYAQLEPFGEDRADLRAGIVASVIANSNRSKGQKPFTPQQFMPQFEPETEEQAAGRLLAQMFKAFGGKR